MSLFLFLTVVQAIVAAALVGIVLIQRSEGGGLGVGGGSGNPGGLMSARGAADFLTRTTKWLAIVFVVLAIVMAAVAVKSTSGNTVDTSLKRTPVPAAGAQPQPAPAPAPSAPPPSAPANNDPLKNVAQ
jgi:preprotein translocase subunit SecG